MSQKESSQQGVTSYPKPTRSGQDGDTNEKRRHVPHTFLQQFPSRHPRLWRWHTYFIVTALFAVLLLAVILTGVFYYNAEKQTEQLELGEGASTKTQVFHPNQSLNLEMFGQISMRSFDTGNGLSLTVRLDIAQAQNFTSAFDESLLNPPNPPFFVCSAFQDTGSGDFRIYPNNDTSHIHDQTAFNIGMTGIVARYPFDVYRGQMILGSKYAISPTANNTVAQCSDPNAGQALGFFATPKQLFFDQSLEGFHADFDAQIFIGAAALIFRDVIKINFTVRRARVTQAMAVIMFFVTWLLTLSIILATIQVVLYKKEPHFELAGAGTALLFALPTLRAAQPGIPTTPTVYDAVGYFWNIVLLGLSVFALITNSVLIMRREKRAEHPEDKTDDETERLLSASGRDARV